MLDTMTMTKIIGGLCGTLLVFLLATWAADSLYHVGSDGHGGDHAQQAYLIETGEADHSDEAVEEVDFAALLETADVGKGEKVFKKCAACHKTDAGANSTGPSLFGIVGRDIGSADGFKGYSDTMTTIAGDWTPEALDEFLTSPKTYIEGTKMSFKGLKKIEDRANLVAYLSGFGG